MKNLLDESIAGRLDRIERSNRKWKLCTLAALVGAGLFGFLGAQPDRAANTITAKAFVVVDKDGRPRITIGVTEGQPLLTFCPEEGPPRLYMGLGGGPEPSSKPFLNFRAKSGLPALGMGLGVDPEDGAERPYFTLSDQHGRAKFLWGLQLDDKPYFWLTDKRYESRLALGIGQGDEPFCKLFDDKGNEITNPLEKHRPPDGGRARP
jgi:hypothetical protein